MKSLNIIAALLAFASTNAAAQINNAKTETVKVYGNCGMCKETIEKAGNAKKVAKVEWNEDTKLATITYDESKTNKDAILKRIALSGYDNESFLAPDDAYNKLPGCCQYEREKKMPVAATQNDTNAPAENHAGHNHGNAAAAPQQQSQLQAVFDNYFALKDALVKTDAATASAKAAALLAALNAVKMETLKADEHVAWMKLEKDLKMNAEHISQSKETDHQRDHFMALSNGMIELVKAAKPAETVYVQHCPMYNDGKGADWLSKENAVKNPYYGSMMLTCGKTVETIKQ